MTPEPDSAESRPMNSTASALVASSSAIFLMLGIAHFVFTFHGPKLLPRESDLKTRMQEVSPVITGQTTMWKAWIGFNASHSIGLAMFGALFGYLAIFRASILFDSPFLLSLGLLLLGGYVVLARRYFFRTPFRAVVLATLLYAAAMVVVMSR
jgi:hypothetical protein